MLAPPWESSTLGSRALAPRVSVATTRGCRINPRRGRCISSKGGLRNRPPHPRLSRTVALMCTSASALRVFSDGFVRQPPRIAVAPRSADRPTRGLLLLVLSSSRNGSPSPPGLLPHATKLQPAGWILGAWLRGRAADVTASPMSRVTQATSLAVATFAVMLACAATAFGAPGDGGGCATTCSVGAVGTGGINSDGGAEGGRRKGLSTGFPGSTFHQPGQRLRRTHRGHWPVRRVGVRRIFGLDGDCSGRCG
jgi:hypothetical protein